MKKKFKDTKVGKLAGLLLSSTADAHPVAKLVKKVILGGTLEAFPLSALKAFMDVNADGKIDLKDFREITWDDMGKLVVTALVFYGLYHFKVLSALGF